jgi:putative DNA methylase
VLRPGKNADTFFVEKAVTGLDTDNFSVVFRALLNDERGWHPEFFELHPIITLILLSVVARVFTACQKTLTPEGRLVIVFANKQPDAWEALVTAIIRAGFVVDGSWPIATEMPNRNRALSSAALSSSVWLVCKKRTATAMAGWDNHVLSDMRTNIRGRLREFWDAGIRGPDFIWAATGPALEPYSRHPIVKKSNEPGKLMTVSDFLEHVRAIVVEYAVGRVLRVPGDVSAFAAGERLDAVTSYYLLHRNDFGFVEAPAGACILYAVSCGLSDRDLIATWDIMIPKGGRSLDEEEEEDADSVDEVEEGSSAMFRLKTWQQRSRKNLGYEAPTGREVPLIDRLHRLMRTWKEGDVQKVNEYLDEHALRRSDLFHRLAQSLIELSPQGSEERPLLESLSNHIGAKGVRADWQQQRLALETQD